MSCIGDFFRHPVLDFFGFQGNWVNGSHDPFSGEGDESRVKEWNIYVAIGLIPVIGQIIAGIKNIVVGLDFEDEMPRRCLVGRGIAQLCLVTYPILFLMDGIVTIGRFLTSEPEGDSESQ